VDSLKLCIGVLCLSACAFAQTVASRIAAHIRAEDLKADVAFLASDTLQGRATPSPGLDAAAEYIASQFRKAGLEPVGDDGYFQTATYYSSVPNLTGIELTLGSAKAAAGSITIQEAVATDLKDTATFKATPAELDSLTAEQVKGKVLVVEFTAGGPIGRVSTAVAKLEPALLVIVRSGAVPNMGARPALREVSAPVPKMPIVTVWDPAIRDAVAAAKPGPMEATVSAHIAALQAVPVKARNVAGLLRGTDPLLRDTYVVVTAHYDHLGVRGTGEGDHIFNGANDDASGTSSVVEIGAALAALAEKPKRSILFMTVFGEEIGGYGARFYTSHPIFPLAKTIVDINLEQLGRTDDSEEPKPEQFNLTGFDYTDIAATMAKAGEATGIKVVKHEKNSDAFFGRSDNRTFADAGIPSTTLSVSYVYPDYHAVGDEWPKLDYQNMAQVDRCIGVALWDMANSEKAPQWNRENPKVSRYVEAWDRLMAK
jgi:hypothetical protein